MSKIVTVGPYKNGKTTYQVTVKPATAETGMYRTLLQEQAVLEENEIFKTREGDPDLLSISKRILHTVIYPAMIAASSPVSGFKEWPVPYSEYAELPEEFIIDWENAVFETNPHWKPKQPESKAETEELEKKVPDSSLKS